MDEPTARLDGDEAKALLRTIRELVAHGTSVIYVSHFLEEVLSIADRITVLRNGRVVKEAEARSETPATLVTAMLGRAASLAFPPKQSPQRDAPIVLRARQLSAGALVHEVDIDVRAGEIVGLAGLVGSGRTEVARLIFGADRRRGGSIEIAGEQLNGHSTIQAIRRGVAYLPESRKDLGLFLGLSGQENVTLPHLRRVSTGGVLRPTREREVTSAIMQQLGVTPANPRARVANLSGGNQQKVMFAKWLWRPPRLLIADEPTRGIDVGAKFAIYELLVKLAAAGTAIVLISSELEEIVELAHRVLVMARGRCVASLTGEEISEDRILHAAFESDAERELQAALA
jgi:simple sugar transport system ATP-binding protein/ribose transport system ATP-binding protein